MAFQLPDLPYDYEALAPYMSAKTLHLHHDKHHQAYVTNLNNLIEGTEFADKSLEEIVTGSYGDNAKQGTFNNAGQHWNHNLFWRIMKKGGGNPGGDRQAHRRRRSSRSRRSRSSSRPRPSPSSARAGLGSRWTATRSRSPRPPTARTRSCRA